VPGIITLKLATKNKHNTQEKTNSHIPAANSNNKSTKHCKEIDKHTKKKHTHTERLCVESDFLDLRDCCSALDSVDVTVIVIITDVVVSITSAFHTHAN